MEDLDEMFGNWGMDLGSGDSSGAATAPSAGFPRVVRQSAPQQQPQFRRPPMRRVAAPPPEPEYIEEEPQFDQAQADSSLPLHEPRTEAEARLHQARYFEVLLANSIFPQANRIGQYVEQRLRQWAENELAILLGMRPSHDLAPFNKKQILALRSLADKLIGNATSPIKSAAPAPVQTQEVEQPAAPVFVPPPPPSAPAPVRRRPLIKRAAPPVQEQVAAPPPPPAPRTQPLIPARKPAAKPSRRVQSQSSDTQATRPQSRASRRASGKPNIDESSLNDGELVEAGGKTFKVLIGSNESGERKVIYQDVTPSPTVASAPPVAMPDGLALEQATMQAAAVQVEKAMKGSRALRNAAQVAMQS